MPCKVGTIRQIHTRLTQEGYAITLYALRQWVNTGKIPSVRSGAKIFIVYNQVLEFLTTGQVASSSSMQPAN